MARILYGLCGEGLGHASRGRILIHYLKQRGHEIFIVAGGKAYRYLSTEFDQIEKIESARFEYKGNQVRLFYSCLNMLYTTIAKTPTSFRKVRAIIKDFKPDILITDSEPISHVAARLHQIKRVSIDNPQALLHRTYTVPLGEFIPWVTLLIALKVFMYGADKYLIYDFLDKASTNETVMFFKPLIQEGIRKNHPTTGDHIFVYQTSQSMAFLCDILKHFDETFIVYGFNKTHTDENIIYKSFNDNEFYTDIATCKAVITNGGFTVLSEALYLKKPICSFPIRHQFEQVLNGQCIQQLGFGEYHLMVDEKILRTFFGNLKQYQNNIQAYTPGKQEETLQRIEQEIESLL